MKEESLEPNFLQDQSCNYLYKSIPAIQIIMTITYLSSFLASSAKVRAIGNKKVAGTIMQSSLLKQASINDNYE
ncbi:hypothetical protein AUF12_04135 [Enterococcus avium]|uniref:hypothetical protein n=1 Tax=Enterococcus avium TaxID=33945 RepID=UPI000CB54A8F|nr:hypothetical protein [Enterococcus avium]PNE49734.1 hypothetical protein AUF12_04135 [Enterococcus avium]